MKALYAWPNGLNDPQHPTYGGWGGFFEWGISADKQTWAYVNQQGTEANPIARKYETRPGTGDFRHARCIGFP